MTHRLLATGQTLLTVLLQGALLFVAMALAFVPFARAPGWLGPTAGYLSYALYPALLYGLLAAAHCTFNHLPIAHAGLDLRRLPAGLALGALLGAAVALLSAALTALCLPAVALQPAPNTSAAGWLPLLASAWQTGFSEELLFRGFVLLALLRRGMRLPAAVAWSVLIFTLAHVAVEPWWWLAFVAATGLRLTALYLASGSLWVSVGCHLALNLVFGLINRGILLRLEGLDAHLAALMLAEVTLALLTALLALRLRRRRLRAGFPDWLAAVSLPTPAAA